MNVNRVTIFRELSEEMIELLGPLFETFSCPTGTVIFQQGDQADYLYMVIDGQVDMSYKPYDGVPITISHVGKDGLFGWSSVVGSDTYTSSALAIENVEALRIHGSDLRRFCQQHPEAGKDILERLADGVSLRWKDSHKQVQSMLFQGISEKRKLI